MSEPVKTSSGAHFIKSTRWMTDQEFETPDFLLLNVEKSIRELVRLANDKEVFVPSDSIRLRAGRDEFGTMVSLEAEGWKRVHF